MAKAMEGPGTRRRRGDSSASPRSSPLGGGETEMQGTPTGKGSRASVGLNSKWLYEKGKASPMPAGLAGSGWGSGSVFS